MRPVGDRTVATDRRPVYIIDLPAARPVAEFLPDALHEGSTRHWPVAGSSASRSGPQRWPSGRGRLSRAFRPPLAVGRAIAAWRTRPVAPGGARPRRLTRPLFDLETVNVSALDGLDWNECYARTGSCRGEAAPASMSGSRPAQRSPRVGGGDRLDGQVETLRTGDGVQQQGRQRTGAGPALRAARPHARRGASARAALHTAGGAATLVRV